MKKLLNWFIKKYSPCYGIHDYEMIFHDNGGYVSECKKCGKIHIYEG